ncbi:MAG: hypothetical protein AABO57_08835 [Acidobacteriota bacterium]
MQSIALVLVMVLTFMSVPPSMGQEQAAKGPDVFQNVEMLVPHGNKADQTPVRLRFEETHLMIESRKEGSILKNFTYSEIKSAEYTYSKHPRWKAGVGAAIAVGIFALPLFFMKGRKHWLTVKTDKDYAVLRLDKNNYKVILPAFETRSGVKVETLGEDK